MINDQSIYPWLTDSLSVHNSDSVWVVWPRACQQSSCHILQLTLITRRLWMPQNISQLPKCTDSPKAPSTFRSTDNNLYGNGVLPSIVQSLYRHVVKLEVGFFDIWNGPTTIEGRPEDSRESRYGNDYTKHRHVRRNVRLTGISFCVHTSQTTTAVSHT